MTVHCRNKRIHIDNYYIFVGLCAVCKLVLMGLFSSEYEERLFVPFLSWYIRNGENPYTYFYVHGMENAFPYPPAMLFLESAGLWLLHLFGEIPAFAVRIVFKLPSFLLDFAGLHFLVRLFPDRRRYAAVFWSASPVVFYAVYMHGQLDLIPTVLLLGAVCYVSSRERYRLGKGAVLLVLAMLCKLHILAALPLVAMYLYKRDGMCTTACFLGVCAAGTAGGLALFWSDGFCRMVLFNREQSALTRLAFAFGQERLYVSIMALLLLYLTVFGADRISRMLFLNLCGMVFAVFLVFCPPMPGWYVWVVPYVALFFVCVDRDRYKNIVVYLLLNLLYLAYFVFLHDRGMTDLYWMGEKLDFLKFGNHIAGNTVCTLLSGTLAYVVFCMYRLGIAGSSIYRRRNVPFTIGIAGDSGSGKSTMIATAARVLGKKNLLFIEGDGDHRWERGSAHWKEFTHLNPKANYLYRQAQDLRQLRMGNAVRRVEYDHDSGHFTPAKRIRPRSYVIMCGLHALYLPQARRHLDLKIYMDVDEKLRRFWKIQRDCTHRGYSKKRILEQIEARMPDAEKYIHPQKEHADMLVGYYDRTLADCLEESHVVRQSLRITVSAALDVERIVDELAACGIGVVHDYSDDLGRQIVEVDADKLEGRCIPVGAIADRVIPHLEEITGESFAETSAMEGIVELFLLLCISGRMREGGQE